LIIVFCTRFNRTQKQIRSVRDLKAFFTSCFKPTFTGRHAVEATTCTLPIGSRSELLKWAKETLNSTMIHLGT